MIVEHLQLTDFRNYRTAEVSFHPGANLVVGSNGQGKTNLVEAIGYLATLSSHRVSTDQALVRHGADSAVVRARLGHGDRTRLVELQVNRQGSNRAQVNRAPARPRDLPRQVASIVFAPEDLALVRGEPAGRRRMLDELLVQRNPRFSAVVTDYDRVLRQRNTLLKTSRAAQRGGDLSTLDVWDDRLIALGAELLVARTRLVGDLRPFIDRAYRAIAGDAHRAELQMQSSLRGAHPDDQEMIGGASVEESDWSVEQAASEFRVALSDLRRQEFDRGITLVGPHRDDLGLILNSLPARAYASHGESWSFALALKLAAADILRHDSPLGDPVVILDDVFAELDEARRGRLAAAVAGFEQVIITAAVEADVPMSLRHNVTRIRAGEVVAE